MVVRLTMINIIHTYINVSNTSVYDFYVGNRNVWVSTVIDKVNSNTSRISTLESKVNSGSTSNAMGSWVKTNSDTGGVRTDAVPTGSCVKGQKVIYVYNAGEGNKFTYYVCS